MNTEEITADRILSLANRQFLTEKLVILYQLLVDLSYRCYGHDEEDCQLAIISSRDAVGDIGNATKLFNKRDQDSLNLSAITDYNCIGHRVDALPKISMTATRRIPDNLIEGQKWEFCTAIPTYRLSGRKIFDTPKLMSMLKDFKKNIFSENTQSIAIERRVSIDAIEKAGIYYSEISDLSMVLRRNRNRHEHMGLENHSPVNAVLLSSAAYRLCELHELLISALSDYTPTFTIHEATIQRKPHIQSEYIDILKPTLKWLENTDAKIQDLDHLIENNSVEKIESNNLVKEIFVNVDATLDKVNQISSVIEKYQYKVDLVLSRLDQSSLLTHDGHIHNDKFIEINAPADILYKQSKNVNSEKHEETLEALTSVPNKSDSRISKIAIDAYSAEEASLRLLSLRSVIFKEMRKQWQLFQPYQSIVQRSAVEQAIKNQINCIQEYLRLPVFEKVIHLYPETKEILSIQTRKWGEQVDSILSSIDYAIESTAYNENNDESQEGDQDE